MVQRGNANGKEGEEARNLHFSNLSIDFPCQCAAHHIKSVSEKRNEVEYQSKEYCFEWSSRRTFKRFKPLPFLPNCEAARRRLSAVAYAVGEDILSGFAWAGGGLDWNSTLSIASRQEDGELLFIQRRGVKPQATLSHSSIKGAIRSKKWYR